MRPDMRWKSPINRRWTMSWATSAPTMTMAFDRCFMRSFKAPPSGISNMSRLRSSRRHFLQAAGVTLALPLLESTATAADSAEAPRRMVAMCFALGLHAPNVIPQEPGADYAATPYLEALGSELRG